MAIWKTKWGWRARFQHRGQSVYAPATFRYKAEAQAWVRDEKARLRSRADTYGLVGLIDMYLDQVQQEMALKTYQEKCGALGRLARAVGDVDPRDVDPPQVAALLLARAKAVSNHAANKDRKNIKSFYRWLQEIHGIMADPTGPIRQKPHEVARRRLVPLEDIFSVILAAPMPERALLAIYWHTGARRAEPLRLRWEDVNLEQGWLRLGTRKVRGGGMSYERLPVNRDLAQLLGDLWRQRDKTSDYLFPGYFDGTRDNQAGTQRAHRLLKRLCARAGVQRFGFHDIRHTVASYLNDLGKVGLKRVQRLLRHQRQTTTEIYTQGSYSDLREEVAALEMARVQKVTQKMSQLRRGDRAK